MRVVRVRRAASSSSTATRPVLTQAATGDTKTARAIASTSRTARSRHSSVTAAESGTPAIG